MRRGRRTARHDPLSDKGILPQKMGHVIESWPHLLTIMATVQILKLLNAFCYIHPFHRGFSQTGYFRKQGARKHAFHLESYRNLSIYWLACFFVNCSSRTHGHCSWRVGIFRGHYPSNMTAMSMFANNPSPALPHLPAHTAISQDGSGLTPRWMLRYRCHSQTQALAKSNTFILLPIQTPESVGPRDTGQKMWRVCRTKGYRPEDVACVISSRPDQCKGT